MLACGMSSVGVVSCAGVGRAVAEWIADGKTSLDFTDFDIRRFGKINMNPDFLADRASEILGQCMEYPLRNKFKYMLPMHFRIPPDNAVDSIFSSVDKLFLLFHCQLFVLHSTHRGLRNDFWYPSSHHHIIIVKEIRQFR